MTGNATIATVEWAHISNSMWGQFWDIQKSAPSMSPMSRYPEYAKALESWWWPQAQIAIRIEDSDGEVGFGFAEDGTKAAAAIIENHLSRLLLGQQATRIDVLWDQMYRASIPYGRGGVLAHALSAIDIALWDLKGRKLGIPVCDLLGGRRREKMPAYASHLQPVGETRLRAEAAGYLAEGYRAMKMRMVGGPADGLAGVRRNIDTVALIREVVGPDIELMVDAYMGWDLRFATAMADALAEFDISWIEEPLIPDQWWAYAKLAQTTSIPIAQGENIFMPSEFLRIAKNGEASVLQPDVHRCGGITGFRRIAQIAESHGLEIAPHAYSAPTVQVCAALGNVKMLEKLTIPAWVEEPDAPPPSAFLGEPDVINGMVDPGWAPGLGISPNPDHPDIPRHWLL